MAERENRRLRVVFMGTPEFAAASLKHLLEWGGCDVVGVYSQPDRPCGRGQVCTPPAVKLLALESGLPVFQPLNFRAQADVDQLMALAPDLLLVAAYGLILPRTVLDIPKRGAINVHASLLPEYRGAAPIQRAIMDGRPVTGITIMQMEAGLDTGDILLQRSRAIGILDTAQTLHDELAEMGGKLLVDALEKMDQGRLVRIPQDHSRATYAAKLSKEEGRIDWNQPVLAVHNRIRGLFPWPGSWFDWDGMPGKTLRLTVHPGHHRRPAARRRRARRNPRRGRRQRAHRLLRPSVRGADHQARKQQAPAWTGILLRIFEPLLRRPSAQTRTLLPRRITPWPVPEAPKTQVPWNRKSGIRFRPASVSSSA
jgi:methionyl-tRNA formyltransferase